MMRLLVLILLMYTFSLLKAQMDVQPYSFFIAGHTSGHFGLHPPFKSKFRYIQSRKEIKFGVFTGDIVLPNPNAQDWNYVDSAIAYLDLPIYFSVGNHDMENRSLYESRYGKTYYHFKYQNDLFVVLDPNIDQWNISEDQLRFFENVIQSNAQHVQNIFVFFHQLLWWGDDNIYANISPNSFEGRAESINFWTHIEPLLHQLPNEVVMFAGDLGASKWSKDFMYDTYDNITLIASGMGEGIGDNFVVINVDAEKKIKYDLLCLNGSDINCFGALTDHKISSTNTNELNNTSFIRVYPNPATESIFLELDKMRYTNIQILNMKGQLVLEIHSNNESRQNINVSHLDKGMYFIKTYSEKSKSTMKLIIQ